MNLYYNIICLVTILGFQLNVQAPIPSRKNDVKSDEGVVSIKLLKEELSDVSPVFQSFRTNAKRLTDNLMKSFNELSVKLPEKKDIPDYIRNLLFIVKLARYIKEKEKHGKTEILIDNVVDSLIFFPKLYETFTKIKNERIPKKKGKVPSREETVRWRRKSANVSRKSRESSELDETLKKKHLKKEKPGHAPKHNDFSESEENGRRKLNKERKSERGTGRSKKWDDDDSPEETTSKNSNRKGKREPARKESSENSEPEVPRKNFEKKRRKSKHADLPSDSDESAPNQESSDSELEEPRKDSKKKRHKHKSRSDKKAKRKGRESEAAGFPSDSDDSGDQTEPLAKQESSDSEPEEPQKNSKKKYRKHLSSSVKKAEKKRRKSKDADFPSDMDEAATNQESSDGELEEPEKDSKKKRHKRTSSSGKKTKKKQRESVAADFPSVSDESGNKINPVSPSSPIESPPKRQHASKKQSTSYKKSSTAGDSKSNVANNHEKTDRRRNNQINNNMMDTAENYLVPLSVYNKIANFISSINESIPEINDVLRIHLNNGYKFLTKFRDLYKITDSLTPEVAVLSAYKEMKNAMEKEKRELYDFADSGLNKFSTAVADEEIRYNIRAFIDDKVIPRIEPANHPVADHFRNTMQLLRVYVQVDKNNWKVNSQTLRDDYEKMRNALEKEWDEMEKLLILVRQKASANNA